MYSIEDVRSVDVEGNLLVAVSGSENIRVQDLDRDGYPHFSLRNLIFGSPFQTKADSKARLVTSFLLPVLFSGIIMLGGETMVGLGAYPLLFAVTFFTFSGLGIASHREGPESMNLEEFLRSKSQTATNKWLKDNGNLGLAVTTSEAVRDFIRSARDSVLQIDESARSSANYQGELSDARESALEVFTSMMTLTKDHLNALAAGDKKALKNIENELKETASVLRATASTVAKRAGVALESRLTALDASRSALLSRESMMRKDADREIARERFAAESLKELTR